MFPPHWSFAGGFKARHPRSNVQSNLMPMRNWLRILSVILALSQSVTLSAAAPHSALGLVDFDHDIGVVAAFHEEHFCLSIKNGKLKPVKR